MTESWPREPGFTTQHYLALPAYQSIGAALCLLILPLVSDFTTD